MEPCLRALLKANLAGFRRFRAFLGRFFARIGQSSPEAQNSARHDGRDRRESRFRRHVPWVFRVAVMHRSRSGSMRGIDARNVRIAVSRCPAAWELVRGGRPPPATYANDSATSGSRLDVNRRVNHFKRIGRTSDSASISSATKGDRSAGVRDRFRAACAHLEARQRCR